MLDAVIQVTEARLVNTLTSTSLTSRSRVISALGRYVERGGFEDCGLRRELGTPVTAVRVVRIYLVDGDEVY
jgi:hypothetical protein